MRRIIVALAFIFAFTCIASGTGMAASKDKHVWLRAGGAGGNSWAYSCMTAISESIKSVDPDLEMVVQATPGSTTHYGMFAKKSIDVGTGYTPTDWWALKGSPPVFKEGYSGTFYNIAPLGITVTQLVVRDDSSLKTFRDLEGKKVWVGDAGAAMTQMHVRLLADLGLKCDQMQSSREDGFELLKEGRLDALITSNGTPYAYVLELATATKIRFLPFSDEDIAKYSEAGPFSTKGYITDKDYGFVKEPVQTLVQMQNVHVRADLDIDVAYRLTKAIVETWPQVNKIVSATGRVDPLRDTVPYAVVKLHPGAIKYYEERGVTVPAELQP